MYDYAIHLQNGSACTNRSVFCLMQQIAEKCEKRGRKRQKLRNVFSLYFFAKILSILQVLMYNSLYYILQASLKLMQNVKGW